jgi:excisionase family DNA binding protein
MIRVVMEPKRPVRRTPRSFRSIEVDSSNVESVAILNVSELSEYLRIHKTKVYRLVQTGEIPGFKIGSDWRFNKDMIDRWRLGAAGADD